jgi:uncharacterized integral membrane protein
VLRRLILFILAGATLLVAVLFTWLNPGSIKLDLAFGEITAPIALAFVTALALGWVLGWLSTLGYVVSLLREQRRLRAAARLAERELEALRAAPAESVVPPVVAPAVVAPVVPPVVPPA